MNQSKRMVYRISFLALAALFVVAVPLFAVSSAQSDVDISDEKLEAVARVYLEVYAINQSYKPRIEAADTSEDANQLQQAANQEMIDVIENQENVTVSEYNDVIGALGDDDELRERLQAHVDEIQEEESQKD